MRTVSFLMASLALVACASQAPSAANPPVSTQPSPEPAKAAGATAEPAMLEPVATRAPEEDICKPGAPTPQDALWQNLAAPPNEWVSCEQDQDCAIAEVGCCDHCNGGRRVVVNSRFAKQAAAKYGAKKCTEGCTEVACAPRVVLCSQHQCTDASAPVCNERADN
jgi:hypothetical protein